MSWRVVWRWLQALDPGAPVNADALLIPQNFTVQNTDDFPLPDLALTRSPSLSLDIRLTEGDSPDYLMVYVVPELVDGGLRELYLLMAELRWEV